MKAARFLLVSLVALGAFAFIGPAEAAAPDRPRTVSIVHGRMSPYSLRVPNGATVIWSNRDVVAHELSGVRFVDRDGDAHSFELESEDLAPYVRGTTAPPASFSHTFVEPGRYDLKLENGARLVLVVDARARTPFGGLPAATPRPNTTPQPTPTPRPTQTPTPSTGSQCADWAAITGVTIGLRPQSFVRLTGTCTFSTAGHAVRLTPRYLQGKTLIVDKFVTRPRGASAEVIEEVPIDLQIPVTIAYDEVVIMPDRVRVPIGDVIALSP